MALYKFTYLLTYLLGILENPSFVKGSDVDLDIWFDNMCICELYKVVILLGGASYKITHVYVRSCFISGLENWVCKT